MKKKKKISVQTIIEVMIRAVFFIIYPASIFHCIYRNKINCRTNYTACKSTVEFLCTDTCCITGLYHCIWTIFLWFCLCIWNMG